MSGNHTPGKVLHDIRGYPHPDVRAESGRKIACTWGTGPQAKSPEAYKKRTAEDRANARRIVACWNACAGIPTESLEANGVASMADSASLVREVAELRAERDQLLAIALQLRGALEHHAEQTRPIQRTTEALVAADDLIHFGAPEVEQRCQLCKYEHGHSIGCENNPVDIALTDEKGRPMSYWGGLARPQANEPAPTTPEPAGDVIVELSPGRRCTYDNRVTMARECWEDGNLVFCVSSEMLWDVKNHSHPMVKRLWDFLPILQHGWHDGMIQGDSMAGPRPPG